ncbi:16S rRNA (guanine(966)-N(2))-methyltransferase RsmD [Hyphococcus sp.]|uniref:16S rRNA (guanine(966)-N(2))-methyltransferase RsmD n=1 Tax=Hyphococcus sp. TaxID=2038636 RepID=UPI002083A7ED|nr:MAG: methyltransferase [Marinicaulis sp.]
MRIIGGEFRGRPIEAPKGLIARPTADRTREALFNILNARRDVDFSSTRVIDLFAGSGALGLEAMSRGAQWCQFVETDATARGAIRDNIEALALFGATRIHRRSATDLGALPAAAGPPFTLAFLDPPYGKDLCAPALASLHEGGWLAPGAVIIVEQGKDEAAVVATAFTENDRRCYGAAQIGIYLYTP